MDSVNINFTFRYVTLVLGTLITLVFVWLAYVGNQKAEILISVIAAGAAITALIYTAINSHFSAKIHVEQLRTKKLENAMYFIETSNTPDMVKAVHIGVNLQKEVSGKSSDEIKALINSSEEKRQALIMILNYFERMGVIVRKNAADEEVLKEYWHAAVKRYYHCFEPWILSARNELQDAALFLETKNLTKRWA